MIDLDSILAPYDYTFPERLIANAPAQPRDSARLLIYDRRRTDEHAMVFDTFHNILDYLPHNAVLVFNQSKVLPARMMLTKNTNGIVEALYIGTDTPHVRVMASGKIKTGDVLTWKDGHTFTVNKRDGKFATLTPSFPVEDLFNLLEQYGETPLPPYIKNSPLSEQDRRKEYQTVYAQELGSVAAPTAGLHFTPELLSSLKDAGIAIAYVTLHVNMGTFAPLTEEHLEQKKLHEEFFDIDAQTATLLNDAKKNGRPIIAVGTTSVRTLESATEKTGEHAGTIHRLSGITDIFITEKDALHFVDGLITNFHVPKSSLLMLVSAFTGRTKLLELYKEAIQRDFRLFSFGDGMLIL